MELKINDIVYDERYDDVESGTTTLYFTAPKEILNNFFAEGTYPDAVSAEISIEVPTDNIEAKEASVEISPTMKIDEGYSDYDWTDVDISYEEIETLFVLAGV